MPKITDLTNYTTPLADDVLPIVDVANSSTKKVTVNNLRGYIDSSAYATLQEADNAAFSAGKMLVITKIYNITSDTTLNSDVWVPKGGGFNISSGKTLTISGTLQAGLYQVFSGDGVVDLSSAVKQKVVVNTMADLVEKTKFKKGFGCEVELLGYHSIGDGGGGLFYWDFNENKANHDGGTIIDPDKTFPTNWDSNSQQIIWYSPGVGTGCWKRIIPGYIINVRWFGAKADAITNAAKAIQKAVDFAGSFYQVYIPGGKYLLKEAITLQIGSNIRGEQGSVAESNPQQHSEGTTLYLSYTNAEGNAWTTTVINPNNEIYNGRIMFVASPAGGGLVTIKNLVTISLSGNANNSTFLYAGDLNSTIPYERGRVTQGFLSGLRIFAFNRVFYGGTFTDVWMVDVGTESCNTVFVSSQKAYSGDNWGVICVNCVFWKCYAIMNLSHSNKHFFAFSNCVFEGLDQSNGYTLLLYGSNYPNYYLFNNCTFTCAKFALRDIVGSSDKVNLIISNCVFNNSDITIYEEGNFRVQTLKVVNSFIKDSAIYVNYKATGVLIDGNTFDGQSIINVKGGSGHHILNNDFSNVTASNIIKFVQGVDVDKVLISGNIAPLLETPIDYSGIISSLSSVRIINNKNVLDKEYSKNGKDPYSKGQMHIYGLSVSGNQVKDALLTFVQRNSSGDNKDINLSATLVNDIHTQLTIDAKYIVLSNLPTSNPGIQGALWNDSGTLKVSS